jgi:hypothetical protein
LAADLGGVGDEDGEEEGIATESQRHREKGERDGNDRTERWKRIRLRHRVRREARRRKASS